MKICENLLKAVNDLEIEIAKIRNDVIKCLTDRDKYFLCDRWDLFCSLHDVYSDHDSSRCSFKTFDKYNIDVSFYDEFYADRYSTISTVDMVVRMLEEDTYMDKFDSLEEYISFVDEFKEELLEKNLKSFIYDW